MLTTGVGGRVANRVGAPGLTPGADHTTGRAGPHPAVRLASPKRVGAAGEKLTPFAG